MQLIKVGAAVLNQIPLDWSGNRSRILDVIGQAKGEGVSVLCLPELCVSGYGCEDAFLSANTISQSWKSLRAILPHTRGLIVSLGVPVLHQHAVFNCACLAVDGRIAGLVAKRFLAGDGIHYEPRWFKPWPGGLRAVATVDDQSYPIGDLWFDCGGLRLGFEICEDAWVANRPGATLALKGVDAILNPSASHFAFGKLEVRQRFVLEGSRAFGAIYLYANLLGNESGRAIYDGGALIASSGHLLETGPRFGFRDGYLASATVDLESVRLSQARKTSFQPNLTPDDPLLVRAPFNFPEARTEESSSRAVDWESGPDLKEEEFTRAQALALFDYLRKSRSHGFVVSLSGGADSAATASLVALMVTMALRELGPDGLLERLRYLTALKRSVDPKVLTRQLLTTVYQASENSGMVTRKAALDVAEGIGARHFEWEIGDIVNAYTGIVEKATGVHLSWAGHDLVLQNIQARVRSPGAWMLANLNNALLLSTSNRSEAAVGYATMDGDTSGGLSPLAGIDKAWLRLWLRWLERKGPADLGPIPALAAVNQQAPTAELRPASSKQTDEDDLMPYDVLDAIERAAIRDKYSPKETFAVLRPRFQAHTAGQLGIWIERFFRLWCRNQWKRERYAPSFHLDDENLDPKTWCRFPILSAGFEEELAELRQWIASFE